MTAGRQIDIDTSNAHPTITFLQDRATRDTIAVDRVSGEVVGVWRPAAVRVSELDARAAAYRAQRRRDADV